ncbi:MAG: hypothetical protein A2836_00495 [Candidatus Taylorbacteria bacterium RIFCSPHIGHO2_01_FULL_45_63]|uniref:Uncharacterized protein n=1 Tax=Candidatus Taylorbacteria bacterium RIFCSPHIGHO2_02_FULL_45_35 TaxID=1802311 RepID=A0A1G2MPD1_9BACT|nr:MAG: hypothetical protein A2836_00495 [Candidatus Taylorbacteria bacterium RIFCSPHIGHO2_01_FULL_45_63]OHA25745.1 MAG: hypothetical protein A3D56_03265 [Candidatus Taylorbacteria bacterium RIFCSPHIGHO2_02_FULL_45_35]OHA34815.1 MAG: hypothetical protein A3A22_00285 [Candidatus Taylorbacteria bacterium RIFCSPLOWO2_01_FULL_45_34b]
MSNVTLNKRDIDLFYRLHPSLMMYVSKKLGIREISKNAETFRKLPLEKVNQFRIRLYENTYLFDQFIDENPYHFSSENLDIVREWKRF